MVKLLNHAGNFESAPPPLPPSVVAFAEEQFDRLQPSELVKNACRSLIPYVTDDFVEDILYDTVDMNELIGDSRFKATYPAGEMSTSSFTILKQPTLDINCRTLRSKNSPESFLKIVANAYSGIQRVEGVNTKLQCNLISQQPDTDNIIIHGFEFEHEIDYWTFVGEIKRSIACIHSNIKQEDAVKSGFCHFVPSPTQGIPEASGNGTATAATGGADKRRSGAGGGLFGSLFSAQKEVVPKNHRWEVNGSSLVIVDTHSQYRVGVAVGAITDTIVGAFDLHDLVALTLSVDYHAPSAAVLVASLAHSEKERDKVKEADSTKICTSSAYTDMVLDVKLKRTKIGPSTADADGAGAGGDRAPKPASYRCSAVQRRGVGEMTVLPLSEEDLLFAELANSPRPPSADATPGSPAPPPPPPPPLVPASSLSPKGFGMMSSLRSPTAATGSGVFPAALTVCNSLAVTIIDRHDPSDILGTHTLSCAELTKAPYVAGAVPETRNSKTMANARNSGTGASTEAPHESAKAVTASADPTGKAAAKSPTGSMFSSFFGKPAGASETATAATAPVQSDSARAKTHQVYNGEADAVPKFVNPGSKLQVKPDFSPHPTGQLPISAPIAKGPALPAKVIKYHDPLFCDVELAKRTSLKAARLVIKRANDLPSSSPALEAKHIPPTVYATVYLVDANGEKRSINSADSRTESIKSHDPEWNKEVLLQNEKQGVDDITAVMVLFRDASLGMLKHHHIGRVNIPFSCFLDNVQADFCLPLEPTYRMNEDDGERLHLGDVHFTTELIEMGPGNKRITSIVRAASSTSHSGTGPHPAFANTDGTTSTSGSAAGSTADAANANAPARRMTIIGSTGSKGKSNAVAVRYCLYRATTGSMWWPVRLLKTVLNNSTTVVTPAGLAPSGWTAPSFTMAAAALPNGLRSDSVGYLWCGYRSLLIDLLPGVTGVLYNCQECSTDGTLTIAWQNVLDCLDVSDSAVLLTLRINTCTSNATQISRQELIYAPAVISLVVGPCQAAALRRECQQRAQFGFVRDNLSELAHAVNAINGANIPLNQLRSISLTRTLTPPSSPLKASDAAAGFNATFGMAPSSLTSSPGTAAAGTSAGATPAAAAASAAVGGSATTLTQLLAANNAASTTAATASAMPTLMDVLPMARSVALALEGIIQHTEALLNHSLLLSLEDNKPISSTARGVLTPILLQLNPPWFNALTADLNNTKKTILPLYSPIVKDRQFLVRTMARAKVYFAFLRHVCGRLLTVGSALETAPGFSLPEFSTEAIQRYVKLDCENVQLFTPLRAGAKVETMITRFEAFLEAALERTRDYVLFSGANWDTKPSATAVDTTSAAGSKKPRNPIMPLPQSDLSGRECVQVLIESYYRTILNYLKPFITSKESFRKITGQDIKNCVLKLLIENNLRYEMSTQLTVGVCLDMKVIPSMPLVDDVNTIIEWYSDSLLHDTRGWLIRTLQNAGTERRNKSNLPWDVEVVGDKIISFLPETLRFQLNVYTELCSVHLTTSAYDDAELKASAVLDSGLAIGLGMNMPSGMQMHPTVPVAPTMTQSTITARVNEMILHAVCEALVLLAEEYHRALQGRHWDKVDTATGKLAVHVEFLSAVANDCHRVLSVHMSELQTTIRATLEVHEAKRVAMVQTFSPPADIALRHIMRIIFTDVQSTLIDLDNIWTNPRNLGARTLTAAISAHLRTLKTALVPDLYFKLVGNCVQVVVTRYLLLLKNRCIAKSPFTMDDVLRFVRDVATIKQCFSAFISEADATTTSSSEEDGEEAFDSDPSAPRELEPPANIDDITEGTAVGKYLALSAFQAIDTMCHLLSAEYDTAVFHRKALNIVERYEGIPASTEFKHKLEKDGNMVSQSDQNIVPVAVLLSCVATLRADTGADLTSFLCAILLSHQHSHAAQGSRACKPILNSPAFAYDVIVKVFAAPMQAILSAANAAAATSTTGAESDSKGGLKGLFSPAGSALKHLREKAADIAVKKGPAIVPAVKNRQNEETAMEIMRTLGLEVQSRVKAPEDKDLAPTQVQRRPSGKDMPGMSNGIAGAGEGGVARNLQADLGDEHGHGSSNADQTADKGGDKAKKKKNGIFAHLHLPHASHTSKPDGSCAGDSSSDSDHDEPDTPSQCLIQIEAIEVRALHSSSFIGGPNPYVYFSVNGRKRAKTSVKWDHKEATWSEKVELPADMVDIQEGRITIKVFDKERMRRKRLVGAVTVKLAPLEYHSFESWYALEGGEQANYGEVHCRMRLVTDTSNM